MIRPVILLSAILAVFTAVAAAQEDSKFSLTVYSTADPATFDPQQLARQALANPYQKYQVQLPGYGVVRETRAIDLKAGENVVRFTDVASGIDPTTVSFESLTSPDSTACSSRITSTTWSAPKSCWKSISARMSQSN